jgi:hypothetical protein
VCDQQENGLSTELRSTRNTKHLYLSLLSLLAIVYSIRLVIKMRDI